VYGGIIPRDAKALQNFDGSIGAKILYLVTQYVYGQVQVSKCVYSFQSILYNSSFHASLSKGYSM